MGQLTLSNLIERINGAWEQFRAAVLAALGRHCGLMRLTAVFFDCPNPAAHRHASSGKSCARVEITSFNVESSRLLHADSDSLVMASFSAPLSPTISTATTIGQLYFVLENEEKDGMWKYFCRPLQVCAASHNFYIGRQPCATLPTFHT